MKCSILAICEHNPLSHSVYRCLCVCVFLFLFWGLDNLSLFSTFLAPSFQNMIFLFTLETYMIENENCPPSIYLLE